MTYEIVNAVERSKAHPETFSIPSKAERDNVGKGDIVKAIFEEGGLGERLWIEIIRVEGDTLVCVVSNEPVVVSLTFMETVFIKRENIIAIY